MRSKTSLEWKSNNIFITPSKVLSILPYLALVFALTVFVQCGKKPGHDKTPYILKMKLGLNAEQSKQLETILQETKDLRERERKQYAGDNDALVKAARSRRSLEQGRIESILNETQKAKFGKIVAEQEVEDHTLEISERLGLDRTTTRRINKIVVRAPGKEEVIAVKKSGDPARLQALKERADKIHEEIEYFLSDEQKKEFRKMIQERMARMDQMIRNDL